MNAFNTLKVSATVAVLSLSLMGAANAQGAGDGGLMKEMMSPANQVQTVVSQTAQANLEQVVIPADHDGGLMKEMMSKTYPTQIKSESQNSQARLNSVVIPSDHDGGLMAEMLHSES